MHIVITGTSRGIGLEFVRQFLERGERITTGVRKPEEATELRALAGKFAGHLRILACDTASDASVHEFASGIGEDNVDLLINNAGISGGWDGFIEANFDDVARTFATNTLGSVRVTRELLPYLRRGTTRKIINISTIFASIAGATDDQLFGYRLSKAALNMAVKSMAQRLNAEGFTVLAVHPGWVKTDMGGPNAPTTAEESVRGMITEITRRGPEDSGAFIDFQGQSIPW